MYTGRVHEGIARIEGLLLAGRGSAYIGEPVSQLDHALQCAALAASAGAPDAVVAAALLHDVGHLCAPSDAPRMDALGVVGHEQVGAAWLRAAGVRDDVCRLVAAHVSAKRWLVLRRPAYRATLSAASEGTLRFQGGPMTEAEARVFEADPLHADALRLRAWDEQAKVPDADVPPLEAYRVVLARVSG